MLPTRAAVAPPRSDISPPPTRDKSPPSSPERSSRLELCRRFWPVYLVACQFGIDSTLWLPTVYSYITSLEPTPVDASHYLSLSQLLPPIIQMVVCLVVGPLAALVGSLKWTTVVLVFLSAIGNFVYSCAAEHGIGSVWALIGGRLICGVASGSSSLAMGYLAVSTSTEDRLEAFSQYRTAAGVALILGPLLSLPLTRIDFVIGSFRVNGFNAPTFVSSIIAFCLALSLAFLLENKTKPGGNPLQAFRQLLRSGSQCLAALLVLLAMFLSSYMAAYTLYAMSERLSANWHIGLTLQSGLQAIVFGAALVGSLLSPTLRDGAWALVGRLRWSKVDELETAGEESDVGLSVGPDVALAVLSFVWSILGIIISIIAFVADRNVASGSAGTAAAFLISCAVLLMGYNVQAAVLPSILSRTVPQDLRVALTPWYGTTVALGKVVAPALTQAVGGEATAFGRSSGWINADAVALGFGLLGISVLLLGSRLVGKAVKQG